MGLENATRRVRLMIEELNPRTVPAVLTGLEAEEGCDTEQVATIQEEHIDEATIYTLAVDESYLSDELSITEFSDFEKADFTEILEFTEGSDELMFSTSEDEFGRPLMPYYRSLEGEGEEAVAGEEYVEIMSEEMDPNLMIMSAFGVEDVAGEVIDDGEIFETTVWEEFTSEIDPRSEEFVPWEEASDGEVIYHTMDGFEETTVDVIGEDAVMYYMTGGAGESPEDEDGLVYATDSEVIDPAVCFMAPVAVDESTADVVDETTEELSLSAFSADDFTASVEETEELELTEEIAVPVAESPNADVPTTPEVTDSDMQPISTDYFSMDAGLLDFYLGIGPKKK